MLKKRFDENKTFRLMLEIDQDYIDKFVDMRIKNEEELEKKDKKILELTEKISNLEKAAVDSCKASPIEIDFHKEFTEFKDEMAYMIKKGIADNIHKSFFDSDENEGLKNRIRLLNSNCNKLGETVSTLQKQLFKKGEELKKLKEEAHLNDEVKENEKKDEFGITENNPKLFELSIEQIACFNTMVECITTVKERNQDFSSIYKIGVRDDLHDFFFVFPSAKACFSAIEKCDCLRNIGEHFRFLDIKQILVNEDESSGKTLVDEPIFDNSVDEEFMHKGKFFLNHENDRIGCNNNTVYFIEDLLKLHEDYNLYNPSIELDDFLSYLDKTIHEFDPGAFVFVFITTGVKLTHFQSFDGEIFANNQMVVFNSVRSELFRKENPLSKEIFQILSHLHPCVKVFRKCSPNILVVRDKSKMGNFTYKSKGDIISKCSNLEIPVELITFNFRPSFMGYPQDIKFSKTISDIIVKGKDNILVVIDDWEGFKAYCLTFNISPLEMISKFLTDKYPFNITFLIFEANPYANKYGELDLK